MPLPAPVRRLLDRFKRGSADPRADVPALDRTVASPPDGTLPAPKVPPQTQQNPRPADLTASYISAQPQVFLASYIRALPPYIDDVSRDLGDDLYERMLLDPQVFSCVRTLKLAILDEGVNLQPAVTDKDDPDYDLSKEVLALCEHALANLPRSTDEWLFEMLDALALGNRVAEQVYHLEEAGKYAGNLLLARLACKPRRSTAFVVDAYNKLVGLLGLIPGSGAPILTGTIVGEPSRLPNLLPREKFAILTHAPTNEDPRGNSLLRAVYNPWALKVQLWGEYLKYLTQFASPSLFATTPEGARAQPPTDSLGNPIPGATLVTPETALVAILTSLRNGSVAAAPFGTALNPLQLGQEGGAFLRAFTLYDEQIAKGITNQTLATEQGKHQARAAAETHKDTLDSGPKFLKGVVGNMLTRDVLRPLVAYNYGEEVAARLTPTAMLQRIDEAKWAGHAQAAATLGYKLDPSQFAAMDEKLGLPVRDEAQASDPNNPDAGAGDAVQGPEGPGGGSPGQNGQQPANGTSDPWADVSFSVQHAPHNMTIQGKEYRGGEFIPAEVMAQATAEERAKVEGKPAAPDKEGQEDKKDADQPQQPVEKKGPAFDPQQFADEYDRGDFVRSDDLYEEALLGVEEDLPKDMVWFSESIRVADYASPTLTVASSWKEDVANGADYFGDLVKWLEDREGPFEPGDLDDYDRSDPKSIYKLLSDFEWDDLRNEDWDDWGPDAWHPSDSGEWTRCRDIAREGQEYPVTLLGTGERLDGAHRLAVAQFKGQTWYPAHVGFPEKAFSQKKPKKKRKGADFSAAWDDPDDWQELPPDDALFAAEDWSKDVLPRKGASQRRWKNVKTGQIRYSDTNPGGKPGSPDKAPRGKSSDTAAPDRVKAQIASLLTDPSAITPEHVEKLKEGLLSLTVTQRDSLKKELSLKASGNKLEQAKKLAERALKEQPTGKAKKAEKEKARPKPKEKPAAPAKEGPKPPEPGFTGIDDSGHEWRGGIMVTRAKETPREAKQDEPGPTRDAGRGGPVPGPDAGDGRPVAGEAGAAGSRGAGEERGAGDKPAGAGAAGGVPAETVPASLPEVNKRLDRFANFFRQKGQHHVADWLGKLRDHVNAVGGEAALAALGAGSASGNKDQVQYWGVGTEEANWKNMGHFMEAYLARNGILSVTGEHSYYGVPQISALGKPDRYIAGDFKPEGDAFKDKLDEAKHLPGLEKSEDIGKLMGKPVTHLTDEVTAKLDEHYGAGQWIVKCYDDNAAAGYGIFFPQRASAIAQDAKGAIWDASSHLASYGFTLARDPDTGKLIGLQHESGDTYQFGTPEYEKTIHGDARRWGDRASAAADNEKGPLLPKGSFMAQPAFKAVGISDAERAAGKTWHEKNEGRVHLVARLGKVEVIPHSTWLKGGQLPVVFEDDDTRAMARAAQDAVNALPAKARRGQVYAPDVMKTADGYKVVELNAQGDHNGSGYLHDNHFTIDSYVSHLTGRVPQHVAFIRKLLAGKKGEGK